MTDKIIKSLKQTIEADKRIKTGTVEIFSGIADDLRAQRKGASEQQERVRNAIDNGTRITKRRIPL